MKRPIAQVRIVDCLGGELKIDHTGFWIRFGPIFYWPVQTIRFCNLLESICGHYILLGVEYFWMSEEVADNKLPMGANLFFPCQWGQNILITHRPHGCSTSAIRKSKVGVVLMPRCAEALIIGSLVDLH